MKVWVYYKDDRREEFYNDVATVTENESFIAIIKPQMNVYISKTEILKMEHILEIEE
jgi:hypothetical protein